MRIVEMVRNDIKNSSLLKTKFLIYAFNGRTEFHRLYEQQTQGQNRTKERKSRKGW